LHILNHFSLSLSPNLSLSVGPSVCLHTPLFISASLVLGSRDHDLTLACCSPLQRVSFTVSSFTEPITSAINAITGAEGILPKMVAHATSNHMPSSSSAGPQTPWNQSHHNAGTSHRVSAAGASHTLNASGVLDTSVGPQVAGSLLKICVVEAKGLALDDKTRCNPHAAIVMGKTKKNTRVENNTTRPHWGDQTFTFEMATHDGTGKYVTITVFNKGAYSRDECIGMVSASQPTRTLAPRSFLNKLPINSPLILPRVTINNPPFPLLNHSHPSTTRG